MKERLDSTHVPTADCLGLEKREAVLRRLLQRFAHIPAGVSLADELVSERRTKQAGGGTTEKR